MTHGLFVGDALAALSAAGVGRIWSTDTVAHSTNAISIVPLLAAALVAQPRYQTPKNTPAAL